MSTAEKTSPDSTSSREMADEKATGSIQVIEDSKVYNADVDVSSVDEQKLLRKIDIALIPWLSLLYLLSFLDRTSIGKCVILLLVLNLEY